MFWLPVFAGLLIARHRRDVFREKSIALLLIGFAAPWLPWLVFVASGWSDFRRTMRLFSGHFELFNPSFYVYSVLHVDGPISFDWSVTTLLRGLPFARVGTWTMLIGCPAACATMLSIGRHRGGGAGYRLAVASLAQTVMFVALLRVKTASYMVALWPLWALLFALIGVWSMGSPSDRPFGLRCWRLLVVDAVEGATSVAHARSNAKRTSAYEWFESEIAGCIPDRRYCAGTAALLVGASPVSLPDMAAADHVLAQPRTYHAAMDLDAALGRVNPDVILVDRYIDDLMRKAASPGGPNHALYVGFERFKARRRTTLTCVVRDRTYGTMQVHMVPTAISAGQP